MSFVTPDGEAHKQLNRGDSVLKNQGCLKCATCATNTAALVRHVFKPLIIEITNTKTTPFISREIRVGHNYDSFDLKLMSSLSFVSIIKINAPDNTDGFSLSSYPTPTFSMTGLSDNYYIYAYR